MQMQLTLSVITLGFCITVIMIIPSQAALFTHNISIVIFIYEEIFSINVVHSCHITSAKIQSAVFQRFCFADTTIITIKRAFLHWKVSDTCIPAP